jgi:hypothetical protein
MEIGLGYLATMQAQIRHPLSLRNANLWGRETQRVQQAEMKTT